MTTNSRSSSVHTLGLDHVADRIPRTTHYATSEGGVQIAYQVLGQGPIDVVFVPAFASNADIWWDHPDAARFLERLAAAARLIVVDKRGLGLSDRQTGVYPMEDRAEDIRLVMDSAGCREAIIFSVSEAAPIAMLFAARFPERTRALVLWGSLARWLADEDYPWMPTLEQWADLIELIAAHWGTGITADFILPSVATRPEVRDWCGRYERASATPAAITSVTLNNTLIDVRSLLPSITTPSLVMHAEGDSFCPVGNGRYVGAHLGNSVYEELPGTDHAFFGCCGEALASRTVNFILDPPPRGPATRRLTTLLVVEAATGSPNSGYGQLVAAEVARHRGGVLRLHDRVAAAAFPWPALAVRCAVSLSEAQAETGSAIRAAVHTAFLPVAIEELGPGVEAVVAIKDALRRSEIAVTTPARDLVEGSGLPLTDKARELPGTQLQYVLVDPAPEGRTLRVGGARARAEAAVGRARELEMGPERIGPLTRRQTEIAYLISCGLTNRGIATRLSLSPRTIENHIFNILLRLDLDSRTQLAAWVARHT